jgi:hypothetical protein
MVPESIHPFGFARLLNRNFEDMVARTLAFPDGFKNSYLREKFCEYFPARTDYDSKLLSSSQN